MNVIVGNQQQVVLDRLDIDIIKRVHGCYEVSELIDMFRTFYFNKMILDVTAMKKYNDIDTYKELINGLKADKIILYIPENSNLCTANFLSQLVDIGIYNFTSNFEGIRYLTKHTNSYQEVEHIHKLASRTKGITQTVVKQRDEDELKEIKSDFGNKVIGFRNVTSHAGSTTLIYMLKKELESAYGNNSVLAIEINKTDFSIYVDKEMISVSKDKVKEILKQADNYKIILIDLNDFTENSICDEVCYLVEPSIIKLNKLIKLNNNVFQRLKGRKVILNKSLLSEKEISNFESEAKIEVFYNIPPLNERKRNEIINDFLEKLNLINENDRNESSNRVFGLFRR